MSKIKEYRNRLEQQKGKKIQTEGNITRTEQQIKEQGRSLRRHEQAREVIREVGIKTQQQLQIHIYQ